MPKVVTSREEIIERSGILFLKNGYHATSIAMLSGACQIQKAHFYYYFKSKEELMRSVLLATHQYFHDEVILKTIESDLPSNAILNELLTKIEATYIRLGGCIIGNTLLETSHQPIFKEELSAFIQLLSNTLIELYYLRFDDMEVAKTKSMAVIQDIQGGIMLMQLNNDVTYLKNAITRARQ